MHHRLRRRFIHLRAQGSRKRGNARLYTALRGMTHPTFINLCAFCVLSGSEFETISPIPPETSGGVLLTVDMVVQRRDGPRRLRDNDDDDYVYCIHSAQVGEAASSHHANHGLCPVTVSTSSRPRHCWPRKAVHKAVVVWSIEADGRAKLPSGSSLFSKGMYTYCLCIRHVIVTSLTS